MIIGKLWTAGNQKCSDSQGNVWSVANLIEDARDLPIMEIPLEHLNIDKELDAMNLRAFVAHLKHVRDADLKYPIILDENGSIFDGFHRVAKALLLGEKTIKAVRFESDPPPIIRGGKDE